MNYEDYEMKIPAPKKPTKPRICPAQMLDAVELQHYTDQVKVYNVLMDAYSVKVNKHRDARIALSDKFEEDLIKYVELQDHPNRKKIYQHVRENCSGSLYEIFHGMEEIAELFEV